MLSYKMAGHICQKYLLSSVLIVSVLGNSYDYDYNTTFLDKTTASIIVPVSGSEYEVVSSATASDDDTVIESTEDYGNSHYENTSYNTDNESYPDYHDYGAYTYDEFIYRSYPFERPVYLYIWEILVILLFLVNIVVISVLLRRKMRNATNMILSAIAVSDTLTGLVTLPTYIMVYSSYDTAHYDDDSHHNDTNMTLSYYDGQEYPSNEDVYILSKNLCRAFMLSKYFLSKMFHTVSIFLTLFLGIQRYASVAFPFKSQRIFSVRNTIIFCLVIFVASPVLHIYHVSSEKAVDGLCQWELGEDGCGGDCIYLWILFLVRHFIPCFCLTIFTALFIKHLRSGTRNLQKMDRNSTQITKRKEENRRISIIVTGIVVVFLIPEIPYGVFLLYSAIEKTVSNGENFILEVNRSIHMGYELLLLLSFNANFYIYTFLNKKFRKCLKHTYLYPIRKILGATDISSISKTSSMSKRTTRKTDCGSSQGAVEMKSLNNSSSDKSVTMQTKLQ